MPCPRQTHKAIFTTLYHKMSGKIRSDSERIWHVEHVYCLSSVWILTLRLSALWVTKHLLHTERWWGRSLACIVECLVKACFCVKCTLYVRHKYGFSPACVLTSIYKFGFILNNSPHTEHTFLYPVFKLVCWFKSDLHLNVLPHRPQQDGCSTVCEVLCFSRLRFLINRRPQTKHCYCFLPVCIFMCKFNFYTQHTAGVLKAQYFGCLSSHNTFFFVYTRH